MKSFIKNNIKFIIVIVICLIGSSITTLATNYIFNSNEVSYDNTESGLHADEVQGAIDEVFQHATDYSEIKNKIGTGSLTTTSNTLIGGVNELNSKFTIVEGRTADNTSSEQIIDYPTGWTSANSIIIGSMVQFASETGNWYSDHNTNYIHGDFDGIHVKVSMDNFRSRKCKIMLMKLE